MLARPLPDLWVCRNRPGSPDGRGAEDQALHIADAASLSRPVVTVSRADDARQTLTPSSALQWADITDGSGVRRRVGFDVETRYATLDGASTAYPNLQVDLHLPAGGPGPESDPFAQAIAGFLRSCAFAATVTAAIPATARGVGPNRTPQFEQLYAVQNQMILDTPGWRLPLGEHGTELDRSDLVFHIPQGVGPVHPAERWVTDEGNLLARHVAAYRGAVGHTQAFLCFSNYTHREALRLGIPESRIHQFPVALPPARVVPTGRALDPAVTGERVAWIGPAAAPEKGLEFLADALEIANARLAVRGRHIALDVYGRVPERGRDATFDRTYDSHYAALVADGTMAFHGFVADDTRASMLATRDLITVNASRPSCEGFGMASAEALIGSGCGYATRPGGGAEDAAGVFDEAFVAAADTPAALAAAIIEAVDAEIGHLRDGGPTWRHQPRPGSIVAFTDVVGSLDDFRAGLRRSAPGLDGQAIA